jgi:hypothetical protein
MCKPPDKDIKYELTNCAITDTSNFLSHRIAGYLSQMWAILNRFTFPLWIFAFPLGFFAFR